MADKEVVSLTAATLPLDGSEILHVIQNGNSRRITLTEAQSETQKNLALFALEIADLKGDRLGMNGGIADPFSDEGDVDTVNSVNQLYDAAGDFYFPYSPPNFITAGIGTETGNCTDGGGLSAASDGVTDYHRNSGARSVDNSSTADKWVGKDWGSGNEREILQVKVYGPNNTGLHELDTSVRIRVQESATGAWTGEEVTIADTGYIDTSSPNYTNTIGCLGTSPVRHHRVLVNATIGSITSFAEVEWFDPGAISSMELISETFTAVAEPGVGRIALQVKENEAVTVNTDFTAEVQRVAGGDWELATLALSSVSAGLKLYEDASVDLSTQASGTAMRWRVKVNAKDIEIHGVVDQWS